MAKNSAPDPRFDPRFQRGYDGPEPDAPVTPAVPSPLETGVTRPLAAQPAPATGPAPGEQAAGDAPAAAGRDAARSPEPAGATDDTAFWSPPRHNPFAIALLVGGIVLIAIGLSLIWSIVTQSTYPDGIDRPAQAFALVQQQVTPALLIAGLFGIVAWLVLGALAAAARRDE